MQKRAEKIFHMPINKDKKISLLNDFILDCCLELEAQSENMRPQVKHNLAEGLRVAKDHLRELEEP